MAVGVSEVRLRSGLGVQDLGFQVLGTSTLNYSNGSYRECSLDAANFEAAQHAYHPQRDHNLEHPLREFLAKVPEPRIASSSGPQPLK